MLILPNTYYSFIDPATDVAPYSSGFYYELMVNRYSIISQIQREEYYIKDLLGYDILMDINRLHRQLVRIHLEILNTEQDDRLTYKEYMEKYYVDCMVKSLMCRGFNPKSLLIGFDEGYRNINNIPTITYTDYGGISWFRISGDNTEVNDFIID